MGSNVRLGGLSVRALLAASMALVTMACGAGDRDEPVLDHVRSPIGGGQPDSVNTSVFMVVSQRGNAGVALCSAALIAPNLLLTARHCVSEVSEDEVTCGKTTAGALFPLGSLVALNAPSIDAAGPPFRVSALNVPNSGSEICGYDLALLTLATNVPASVATPLVPRVDRAVMRGEPYSAVGYGLDSSGEASSAGLRRVRAGLEVACAPGTCGGGAEPSEFVGETGVCSGDSGGPALDARGKLVGVVSRSGSDCAHPVYGSLASWKSWLSQVAQQAAEQGEYAAPFWVTSGLSDPFVGSAGANAGVGAGGAPSGMPGIQGAKCAGPEQCGVAFACYSPTNSADDARCSAWCSKPADCANDSECSGSMGVCVAKAVATPDSDASDASGPSCALDPAGPGRAGRGAALALSAGALLLVGRKRRRASSPKRVFGIEPT